MGCPLDLGYKFVISRMDPNGAKDAALMFVVGSDAAFSRNFRAHCAMQFTEFWAPGVIFVVFTMFDALHIRKSH